MQVKNTQDHYVAFTARMNHGAKTKGIDAHGNEILKDALPQLKSVTIPPLATVEIDDAIWNAATKGKPAKRQKIVMDKEPVQIGTDKNGAVAEHFISVPNGSGVFTSFNPVLDLVKLGHLVIVEHAKLELTMEQMRAAVEKAQGYALPEKVDEAKLMNMYHLLCS